MSYQVIILVYGKQLETERLVTFFKRVMVDKFTGEIFPHSFIYSFPLRRFSCL